MDNPIDEIIAIDKAARKTVAEAEQKAKEILASAQEEKLRLKEESAARLSAETKEQRFSAQKLTDVEIERIEEEAEEKCRLLNERMTSERSARKAEIVSRIIGLAERN